MELKNVEENKVKEDDETEMEKEKEREEEDEKKELEGSDFEEKKEDQVSEISYSTRADIIEILDKLGVTDQEPFIFEQMLKISKTEFDSLNPRFKKKKNEEPETELNEEEMAAAGYKTIYHQNTLGGQFAAKIFKQFINHGFPRFKKFI